MSLKQYLFPQKLLSTGSKLNSRIEVIDSFGHKRLDMGGLIQSGKIIEDIWNTGFTKLLPRGFSPKSVLILGFGAGSAARLLARKWPKTKITGVEIDKQVINLAKKYFAVSKIPHLKIINSDAHAFVYEPRTTRYDLTLVDCYLGDQFPKKLESLSFYTKLSTISDHVLINRLFWGQYQQPTIDFLNRLEAKFACTHTRTPSNFLIHFKPPSQSIIN
jgi:SAM-dependent methyltransferase